LLAQSWAANQQLVIVTSTPNGSKNIHACQPNAAHEAIAKLQEKYNVISNRTEH
jgi:NAD-dependent SIR2 family protein deacetylase